MVLLWHLRGYGLSEVWFKRGSTVGPFESALFMSLFGPIVTCRYAERWIEDPRDGGQLLLALVSPFCSTLTFVELYILYTALHRHQLRGYSSACGPCG